MLQNGPMIKAALGHFLCSPLAETDTVAQPPA